MGVINDKGFPFTNVDGDRVYSSETWREYFNVLIKNGVVQNSMNECEVKPQDIPNKTIYVDSGTLFINGAMRILQEPVNLICEENISGNPRVDRVVAKLDLVNRQIGFFVKQGTPDVSPIAPELERSKDVWELCLADISIENGFNEITETEIIDQRSDVDLCGASSMTIGVIPPSGLDAVTVKASQTTADIYHVSLINANVDTLLQKAKYNSLFYYSSVNGSLNDGFIYDIEIPKTITIPNGITRIRCGIGLYGGQTAREGTLIKNGTITMLTVNHGGNHGADHAHVWNEGIFEVEENDVLVVSEFVTTFVVMEV